MSYRFIHLFDVLIVTNSLDRWLSQACSELDKIAKYYKIDDLARYLASQPVGAAKSDTLPANLQVLLEPKALSYSAKAID